TVNGTVALRTSKSWPLGSGVIWCLTDGSSGFLTLRQESFFRSLGPAPVKILSEVSRCATRSDEHKQSASHHDRPSYHGPPRACREPTTDRCRCNKCEAHNRNRQDVKQKSETAGRNRHVDNAFCPYYREDNQDEGGYSLVPRRATEY